MCIEIGILLGLSMTNKNTLIKINNGIDQRHYTVIFNKIISHRMTIDMALSLKHLINNMSKLSVVHIIFRQLQI